MLTQTIGDGTVELVLTGSDRPTDVDQLRAAMANDDHPTPETDIIWLESVPLGQP